MVFPWVSCCICRAFLFLFQPSSFWGFSRCVVSQKANPSQTRLTNSKFSHFSQSFRQRLSRFRILLRLYRLLQYVHSEVLWYLIFPLRTGFLRGHLEKQLLKRLADLAPADCVELLKPNFPLGGKRIINDLGYLEALNRENVHPIKGRIKKFTKKGIVTEDGEEQEVDVVILATGFDVVSGRDALALDLE